jgi:hypothetical protein
MVETVSFCFTRSMIPPANRQTLTHRVKLAEQGKPNYFHLNMESDPQGELIGKWVKDVGESESRSVMERIRVQDLPGHEREQTSDGCWITGNIRTD